ncbi:MAG: hypothetical protein K0A90_00035 [Methanosarcinaceae archaeon]|nr:hypothetical protein [Methanosarcinaceae archaeon]
MKKRRPSWIGGIQVDGETDGDVNWCGDMTVQVTEKYFLASFKRSKPTSHITKIQVNQFAHTSTSADYLAQTELFDVLIECKQITMKTKVPVFVLDRVTQETKLLQWSGRYPRNKSYLFVVWWFGSKSKSHAFLIDIDSWIGARRGFVKKSMTLYDFMGLFKQFMCDIQDGFWVIKV